jgi:hypothetical protein
MLQTQKKYLSEFVQILNNEPNDHNEKMKRIKKTITRMLRFMKFRLKFKTKKNYLKLILVQAFNLY